jgi:predicted GNAT family acetyltransferase
MADVHQASELPHVIDNKAAHRFEAVVDGLVATLTYRRNPKRLVLVHTEVPDALAGRGIGSALVDAAIAAAAEAHLTVVPRCPFARQWLQAHPEAARRVVIDWPPTDRERSEETPT